MRGARGERRARSTIGVVTMLTVALVGLGGLAPHATSAATRSVTSAWSVAPNVAPAGPPFASMFALTCPTATTCLALGQLRYSNAIVAARSTGTAWSFVPAQTPKATGALTKMSCTSTTSCFAVGAFGAYPLPVLPLMERWNGTRWTLVAAPKPAKAKQAQLTGISCRGPKFCMAVGSYGTTKNGFSDDPFAARWDGTKWSIVAMAVPKGAPYYRITTVSCTSATNCFAVGNRGTFDGVNTLTERWNGTKWSVVASPTPVEIAHTSNDTKLIDVSCTSPAFCFALGYYLTYHSLGLSSRPYALRWNGSKWSRLSIAVPLEGGEAKPFGVSCTNPASCLTTGYAATEKASASWVTKWNGTSWDTIPGAGVGLSAVSCVNPTPCVGIGGYTPASASDPVMVTARFDGSSWTTDPPPLGGSQSQLSQVACPTASFCLAVGERTNLDTKAFGRRWDGTKWSTVDVADPAGAVRTRLTTIACASTTSCIALGDYTLATDPYYVTRILAERWDGATWSVVAAPEIAPTSVSCPSSTMCMAVQGNAWRWDGTTWTMSDNAGGLSSVSCSTVTNCMAVGANAKTTRARRWNGTIWSTVATPNPPGSFPGLTGVSCTAPDACTAVGNSNRQSGTKDGTFAERWNGTKWSIASKPAVAGANPSLLSISCANTGACVAVGTGSGKTLIEEWNGSAWAIVASPNRPGSRFNILSSVSCPTATACFAAGWAATDHYSFGLIEQRS